MKLKKKGFLFLLVFALPLAACSVISKRDGGVPLITKSTNQTEITAAATESTDATTEEQGGTQVPDPEGVTATLSTAENTITLTTKPTLTPFPEEWMGLPVVPEVSERAVEIYRQGLKRGNDPNTFSKIGDCQNVTDFFFSAFENPASYTLGEEYAYLAPAVEQFQGSFGRESLAVEGGMNVAAVLSPLRADPALCGGKYSPLICEILRHRPVIAIISFEEWWGEKSAETYGGYMRQVVEQTIAQGVVPILVTKADNLEGDYSINQTIVDIAREYEIPLWNFWRAVQDLPDQGLRDDNFHLTYKKHCYHFDQAECLDYAWTIRNLTGLQSLHAVWQGLSQEAQAE
jgi:hypothetical protein